MHTQTVDEARSQTLRIHPRLGPSRQDFAAPRIEVAELGVIAAIFLVYTNAIVVAVHFHGVPAAAAGIVPLLLVLPIAQAVLLRGEKIWVTPALVCAIGLVAVQFIGCLFAVDPPSSMKELVALASEGALLYFLVSNAIRNEATLRRAVWALLAAGLLMGLLLTFQQVTQSYDEDFFGFAQLGAIVGDDEIGTTQPRLAGPIGEVNKFAQIMAMLIPLALCSFGVARTAQGRFLTLAALLFTTLGMALAFSRGVAVGVALAFMIMVVIGAIRARVVALAALVALLAVLAVPQYATRLSSVLDVLPGSGSSLRNADAATRGRLTEMQASLYMFLDHPIIGVGPAMSRTHYREYAEVVGGKIWNADRYSHSLYLGLAAEHGLLGLAAFAGLMGFTLRDLQRVRRRYRGVRPDRVQLATGLMMCVIVYLTTGLFLHASYARYAWLILGLTGAASRILMIDDPARRTVQVVAVASEPSP